MEDVHVLRDGGGRELEEINELTEAELAVTECEQSTEAGGVAEGTGDGEDVAHGYSVNSSSDEV
jgi:hypothetical protein